MKSSTFGFIAILALIAPVAAHAQGMPDMKGMKMAPATAAPAVKTGKATGVVKGLDAKAGTVTLQHGAIPGVGWPAMTMMFKAKPPMMLKGLKVGQTVDFDVRTPPTGPEVTALRPH
jgi:Cu(I)/Ag(I) efflux system protein CusF